MKIIRRVNLFRSLDSHTELDIRNEFLSTRLYLIFLIITLTLLIEYYSLLISKIPITISSPSFDTIVNMNESSLKCPCSSVIIPLKTFISIEPIFHPICSSDFINDTWLNTVDTENNYEAKVLQKRFRILSLLCDLAQQTLAAHLRQLGNGYLLNTELLSENHFEAQINVNIHQTIAIARSTFADSFHLMVDTTKINQFLSADDMFQPSGAKILPIDAIPTKFFNKIYSNLDNLTCSFVNQLRNITLNEFYTNCDAILALLNSSLVSFYNITFIESLNIYIVNISNRPLNLPIIYSKNATILFILNTLMLDTYSMNLSYEEYLNKCHPHICTYTKKSRESLIDIILAITGVIGGITGISHFLIEYFIRFIRKPKTRNHHNTLKKKIHNFIISVCNKTHSLNLFRHSGDFQRNEIISTRVFILLFIIIFVIFIFYTSLTLTTRSVTIIRPTYETFISLDKQYSSSLLCSCSNLATYYQTFVSFSPKFHQICSSTFNNNKFLELFRTNQWWSFSLRDFRQFAWHIFAAIRLFCDLSQKIVKEQIKTFLATKFVSSQAMNKGRFQPQIDSIIQAMMQTTERQTTIPIKLIRDITYSNQVRTSPDISIK